MEFDIVDGKPSFFGFGRVSDEAVQQCIEVFNTLTPVQGKVGAGTVDKTKKDSWDVAVHPNYCLTLQHEVDQLKDQYTDFFGLHTFWPKHPEHEEYQYSNWLSMRESINIQKYPLNGGFHQMHCEFGYTYPSQSRELVWMTFLNDVHTGGETFFPFQQRKIKPEKGLTILWPAWWTHGHKGLPAPTTEKMIATGWYNTPI